MIVKENKIRINDGGGLYDTAGILRSAIDDINALILQGVQNWGRAVNAIAKIESAIRAVKARDDEDEKRQEEELKAAEAAAKVVEFVKGDDLPDGDV